MGSSPSFEAAQARRSRPVECDHGVGGMVMDGVDGMAMGGMDGGPISSSLPIRGRRGKDVRVRARYLLEAQRKKEMLSLRADFIGYTYCK